MSQLLAIRPCLCTTDACLCAGNQCRRFGSFLTRRVSISELAAQFSKANKEIEQRSNEGWLCPRRIVDGRYLLHPLRWCQYELLIPEHTSNIPSVFSMHDALYSSVDWHPAGPKMLAAYHHNDTVTHHQLHLA